MKFDVRFVAIAKTKRRKRKTEGRESCPYESREQIDQLGRQIGKWSMMMMNANSLYSHLFFQTAGKSHINEN